MTSTNVTKFDAAVVALQNAMRTDLAFEEALKWDAKFRQFYAEHVQTVIESSPAFTPLALNLDGRLSALIRRAKDNGSLSLDEVEAVMGVPALVFKAFLSKLRINDGEALLYLGDGHVVTFDFTNINQKGVH